MSTEVRGVVIVGPECKGCGSGMEDTCRRWWPDGDEYFLLIAGTAFQFGFFEGFTVDQKRMWEC